MARFVVYGAGAIGGAIAGRLHGTGQEVVAIARGAHREAIAREGLRLISREGEIVARLETVETPAELDWRAEDVVVLAIKGQSSAEALAALVAAAPPEIAVACAQNGVDNERLALRWFAGVYAIVVQLPATHLEPGVVITHSSPVTGSLDLGRYPAGVDERAEAIAAAFGAAGFASVARADIMRWKYAKLLRNLGNSVQAMFEHGEESEELACRAWAEALDVYAAAGIDHVGDAEYDERHSRLITIEEVPGHPHTGGSSWQSLARESGSIEAGQLNGEVVLLGRLHGMPTPVNELLAEWALAAARARERPGSADLAAFMAALRERG